MFVVQETYSRNVLSQDVKLHKIHTNEQVAYIFTKTLNKVKFEVFRKALGVIEK